MHDYPIPKYAAYLWTSGDDLFLGLPGPGPGQSLLRLPPTEAGLRQALSILRHREYLPEETKIATRQAPTQYIIDQWLKTKKKPELSLEACKHLKIEA